MHIKVNYPYMRDFFIKIIFAVKLFIKCPELILCLFPEKLRSTLEKRGKSFPL
ncbi:MAG: hypothetical protein ABIH00_08725 [Armatimonadota bacterium]